MCSLYMYFKIGAYQDPECENRIMKNHKFQEFHVSSGFVAIATKTVTQDLEPDSFARVSNM